MLLHNRVVRAAAMVAAVAMPTVAWGEQSLAQSEQTIYLRAFVPVYCNVEITPSGAQGQAGLIELGIATELCNAPRGYRVIVETQPGLTNAALLSNDTRIPLSESGETVLVDSDHPGLQTRNLALDLGDHPATLTHVGIRIEVNY